jgi:hypothetical protein
MEHCALNFHAILSRCSHCNAIMRQNRGDHHQLQQSCLAALLRLQVSGCRRYIKLGMKDAQNTYNQLQAMLQARLDAKLAGSSKQALVPGPQAYPQSPAVPQQYSPAPQMYAAAQAPPAGY